MKKRSWYREGFGGYPDSHWEEVIRDAGYALDHDHAADAPLDDGVPRDERAFPGLAGMLLHMDAGDMLGVGDFGMLASGPLWAWVAETLKKKLVALQDCTTGFVLDLGQPGAFDAGYAIAVARRDHIKATAPSRKGKLGRPKDLTPAQVGRLRKARAAGDPVPSLAKRFGVSVATVYRYLRK